MFNGRADVFETPVGQPKVSVYVQRTRSWHPACSFANEVLITIWETELKRRRAYKFELAYLSGLSPKCFFTPHFAFSLRPLHYLSRASEGRGAWTNAQSKVGAELIGDPKWNACMA